MTNLKKKKKCEQKLHHEKVYLLALESEHNGTESIHFLERFATGLLFVTLLRRS